MTEQNILKPVQIGTAPLSRRRFLARTSAGVAGSVVAGRAAADTLADFALPREPGGGSFRSQ
jgi:hypothetical protein